MNKKAITYDIVEIVVSVILLIVLLFSFMGFQEVKQSDINQNTELVFSNIEYQEILREFSRQNLNLIYNSVENDNYDDFYVKVSDFFKSTFYQQNWQLTIYKNEEKQRIIWKNNFNCPNSVKTASVTLPIKGSTDLLILNLFKQNGCVDDE